MPPDPHPWASRLESLHAEVWTRLIRGVHDRRAAARHPTLATVALDGSPQARTVVLRAADRASATLRVYTDAQSAKMDELQAHPHAALHVWDSGAHLQIRLAARVSVRTGDEVAGLWAQLPEAARLSFGCTPASGQPIPDALAYRKVPDPAVFAVLELRLQAMDIVHLGPQHRRARYARADGWAGVWCAP